MTGTIKWFRSSDGSGYIKSNNHTYLFCLQSVISVNNVLKPKGPYYGHENEFLLANPTFNIYQGQKVVFTKKAILGRDIAFNLQITNDEESAA